MLTHILLILRLMLLTASVYGYLRWIGNRVRMEFAPGIFFTSLCSVMFLAGILNILPETAWAVWGIGIFLTLHSLRKKESLKPLLCPGMVFFLLTCCIMAVLLHGIILTDYDDFSHWGTVLKVLYTKHRFPNYADAVITYQSYPTGSAALIYWFLAVGGITSEWFQLLVQSVFQVALLTGLFAFLRGIWRNLFGAVAAGLFLLCSNGPINLLVDTLLPLMAVGALCFAFYYRSRLKALWFWLLPYLAALTAIKNSGLLLAVFLLVYLLPLFGRQGLKRWLLLCSAPGLALLLWQKHVQLVFDNALNSRHAMSMDSIASSFLRKDGDALAEVTQIVLSEMLSFTNPVLYLLAAAVLIFLLRRLLGLSWAKDHSGLLLFAGGVYFVYQITVLGMYLTTMPYGEAVLLAGYGRYHRTILIFSGGCLFLALADSMTGAKRQAVPALLTLLLLYQALFPGLWYNNPKHCGFIREEFQQLVTEHSVQTGKRYLILLEPSYAEKYSGYLHYLVRYLLDSAQVKLCSIRQIPEELSMQGYDYLICFGDSGELDEYLLRTFGSREIRVLTLPQP